MKKILFATFSVAMLIFFSLGSASLAQETPSIEGETVCAATATPQLFPTFTPPAREMENENVLDQEVFLPHVVKAAQCVTATFTPPSPSVE